MDFVGVFAFAVSGALRAGQERMDIFGVLVVAAVTAIGGGTLGTCCSAIPSTG